MNPNGGGFAAAVLSGERRARLRGRPSGVKGRYRDRCSTGLRPALDPGASTPLTAQRQGQEQSPCLPNARRSRSNPTKQSRYGSLENKLRQRVPERTFLYTCEQLAANPMQLVGRPKLARPLPKALPRQAVQALLDAVAQHQDPGRQTDWGERDLVIILTALLAGLRADELRQADVGDIRTTDDRAAVIYVKGKGGNERSVPSRPSWCR
jgi:integrase